MDAYHHTPRYPRPPPPPSPSMADSYHPLAAPPPPPPPQSPWFSNQFSYQPQHSASPPQQWAPPPPPQHGYPTHHPPSQYTPQPPPAQQWGPPQMPPQGYHHGNQEWGNASWANHQAQKNEEDWAAKVKAWVEAKAAMENQHSQAQFSGRPEEQSHNTHSVNSHYTESQQQPFSAPAYQQFPVPGVPSNRPPAPYQVEPAPFSSVPPSSVANGTFPGDVNSAHPVQDNFPIKNSSVHQQEVPSSYSSVAGNDGSMGQKEHFYSSQMLPTFSPQEGHHHLQQTPPSMPYGYGNHSGDVTANIADQPLEFSQSYSRDHNPHIQYAHHNSLTAGGGADSISAMPPVHSWAPPVTPDAVYPPIPPTQQHDASVTITSSIPGPAAPFGSFPGTGFQPSVPSPSAPYGLGSAPGISPTAAFPGDAYAMSSVPERPKKASVPNWLREEIIKKKAVISSSSLERPKEEAQSIEDDEVGKSLEKSDQADSKSVDSSRSTEEDDDEDSMEAARTAAINQEIKRILTEVLLKVTDELFDEIATKVLNEDDPTVAAVDHVTATTTSNRKLSPSPPAVPASKASAKVLVAEKARESDTESMSRKSSSSAPGNILGLANYASDEDDADEIESSSLPSSRKNSVHEPSIMKESNKQVALDNGGYENENEKNIRGGKSVNLKQSSKSMPRDDLDGNKVDNGKELDLVISSLAKECERENVGGRSGRPLEIVDATKKEVVADFQDREARVKVNKNDRQVGRSSSGKRLADQVEGDKIKEDKKRDESSGRQDERQSRKEKKDDRNGLKEKMKDQVVRSEENSKDTESTRRSSYSDLKGDRRETQKDKSSIKDDPSRKRERDKHKDENRSRHRDSRDVSQHKRRRSPSADSRGRSNKEKSNYNANASSDETSDDSRRKLHSRRRNTSPSPVRSRRRQVSRSPHSKHDQRRHSPYSSIETSRGRSSRSKSPKRRHR